MGLNVLGKYEKDNKWFEDRSYKSEWAIAYRDICYNKTNKSGKIFIIYLANILSKKKSNFYQKNFLLIIFHCKINFFKNFSLIYQVKIRII